MVVFVFAANLEAQAQLYINEIYFDPPGNGDLVHEYIELRGTPNASLADHYLIFLENESSATSDPGAIEALFDLGSLANPQLGANGFLTLRQTGNVYTDVDPQSNNISNTTEAFGWGVNSSTVGWDDEPGGTFDGIIENSGFTAMLIKNNGGEASAPIITEDLIDLDEDDDNILDTGTMLDDWTVFDSIGINAEASDIGGFLYAPFNFGAGTPEGGANIPDGATYVDVGYEIEYIGRWGDSTGSTEQDWHASNVTDDNASGFDGPVDFRQAGDPHGISAENQFVETSQGVPYGTNFLSSLGSSNFFIEDGDYDPTFDGEEYVFDGDVDGSDFLTWQRNLGFGVGLGPIAGETATRQHGDGNRDRTVDGADLTVWTDNYGQGVSAASAITAVPEPATLVMVLMGLACRGLARPRRTTDLNWLR